MRVEFQTEGGIAHFPGLSRPVVIESDVLAEEDARELKRLVEAARFFERPTVVGAPRCGAADYRQYTIIVEEEGRQHTIQLADPVEDPALQELLRFLQTRARALRRAGGGA
jgi:UTP-glucose-1-phosphate uridylyltransferase